MNVKLCILSLCLFTGFFVSAQSGTTVIDSIQYAGVWRSFRLYVPPTYTPSQAAPLVLNLHGLGSNAIQQQFYGNFMPIADTAGFLVLHPQGTSQGGTAFWNVGLLPFPDDVGFLRSLIDTIKGRYVINSNRVYSTGMSNGAIMSYYLACQLPGNFAAVASVAGTMFRSWYATCVPDFALPVMEIHGDNDLTVPYGGDVTPNGSFMPVDSVVQKWRGHNWCAAVPQVIAFPNTNPGDFSTATNYRYLQGRDQSSVELIRVFNGGHTWPGVPPVLPGTNLDFNASLEIWRFFNQYRRNQFLTPNSTTGLSQQAETAGLRVYPNPVANDLMIEADGQSEIHLYSGQGQFLSELKSGRNDLSGLSSGLYLLRVKRGEEVRHLKLIKE